MSESQTFSAYNWALYRKGLPNLVPIIDKVFRDPGHCRQAYKLFIERKKHGKQKK